MAEIAWVVPVLGVAAALGARQILPAENRRAVFEEISAAMGLDEVAIPFAEAVPVPVRLRGVKNLGAQVAGVPDPVPVPVQRHAA